MRLKISIPNKTVSYLVPTQFLIFGPPVIHRTHLDHTDARSDPSNNLQNLRRLGHVHAHTQVGAFAVHDGENPLGGRVGMQGNARGVCLECGWVRHFFLSLDGGCRETKWGRKMNGKDVLSVTGR